MAVALQRPEVLAPVGGPDCLPAAVAGGADAVYLGLRHFNARGRAENFRLAHLPRHVAYLHRHGLKCYVVFNTLVHDDEYPKAIRMAHAATEAGVDAAIIQDLGLWTALGREVPHLSRHASTQMSIHDPDQVRFLADRGAERVIVARELTLQQLEACVRAGEPYGCEVEHFVHGAMCYAFSGQCLMSNFAGCRSANRGTCAQNCRFVYTGADTPESGPTISMRDLDLLDRVRQLMDIGIASFKIEGRLKGPEYVYAVSRAYRRTIDSLVKGEAPAKDRRQDYRFIFGRPASETPLDGEYGDEARLAKETPDEQRADGHLLKLSRKRGQALLQCEREPLPGSGFRCSINGFEDGFQVLSAVDKGHHHWECRVRIQERGPGIGQAVPIFQNADPEFKERVKKSMAAVPLAEVSQPTEPIRFLCTGRLGEPLVVRVMATAGHVNVASEVILQRASGKPLDRQQMTSALGALGGTPYHLHELIIDDLDDGLFLPKSVMKSMRRSVVEALQGLKTDPPLAAEPSRQAARARKTDLIVVVADAVQASKALACGADSVWIDDPRRSPGDDLPAGTIALLQQGDGKVWLRHHALAPTLTAPQWPTVCGHLGALAAAHAAGVPVIADHFCNVYSTETLAALGSAGASMAVVSLECSSREVARLMERCHAPDLPKVALTVAGHLPSMLTRQDHGLGAGDQAPIVASDEEGGLPYIIQRRSGQITTILEGRMLCAPEETLATRHLVDAWVCEFGLIVDEDLTALTSAYRALLDGDATPDQVSERMASMAHQGLFSGHLAIGSRALDEVAERMADA